MLPLIFPAPILMLQVPPPPDLGEILKGAVSRSVVEVPAGVTRIREASLPEDTASNRGRGSLNPQDPGGNPDNLQPGLRVLRVLLAPGERLTARQKLHTNLLQMSIASTEQDGAMTAEILKVNKAPAGFRARSIRIRNLTAAPFPVLLRLSGPCNYPYDLELEKDK